MSYGFWGKILEVDLTSKTWRDMEIKENLYKRFLGGSGLGGALLHSLFDYKKPAMSEENPLMFMPGLLLGAPAPSAAKTVIVGKSPLTNIWGESVVGGSFGPEIKRAGYDGVIVKGKAETPVVIYIEDQQVKFIDASYVWGKDVYETEKTLRGKTDEKAETACIGPAGERLVPIASIMILNGKSTTRAAGRCGFGCLMGYKKLKAVIVRGTKKIPIYDSKKLSESVREFNPFLMKNAKVLHDYGTLGTIQAVESEGDLPIKNWTLGSWEDGAAKTCGQMLDQTTYFAGHHACYACPVRCGKDAKVPIGPFEGKTGHAPEYETAAGFGANLLNDDLVSIIAVNDICNRYGIDTIEAANAVALAIECYENGLLTAKDTDGIKLKWGMSEDLIPLVLKIALKEEGIGELLGKGVKTASEEIGGLAKEFAIQTKGLSYAMHDPRAYTTMVANYATANRGACHLEALGYFSEGGAFPAKCINFYKKTEHHGYEGKAEYAVRLQDFMCLFNALGLCKFIMLGHITHEIMRDWINAVTGWNLTTEEVRLTGERLFNLKRMYNVKLGISRKDDVLPQRLLMHDRKTGAAAGSIPHYPKIMHDYYKYRKWSNEGIPTTEKLKELEIEV